MKDWNSWLKRLKISDNDHADDVIDELSDLLLGLPSDPSSVPIAIEALNRASSELSCRTAAIALAYSAGPNDLLATDALYEMYLLKRNNVFLAPSILFSLGLLSLRNEDARAATLRLLLRLNLEDPRPLLVAGAKVAGLLLDREDKPELRKLLVTLGANDDPAVRSEGLYQFALLRFADALAAQDHFALIASLRSACDAFRTAEISEELRQDARLFRLLIEASLEFDSIEVDRTGAAGRIGRLVSELRQMGRQPVGSIFQLYRSPALTQIADRCIAVASSLEDAAVEVADSDSWTNFDLTIATLANCYAVVHFNPVAFAGNYRVVEAFSRIAGGILTPRLGPVLARKLGPKSLAKVVANYETRNGKDGLYSALITLQQASWDAEHGIRYRLSEQSVALLFDMAEKAGCTPDEFVQGFNLQISASGGAGVSIEFSSALGRKGKRMGLPTVGVIVALDVEFDAVELMLSNTKPYRVEGSGGGREFVLGEIPSIRSGVHQVILAQTMAMGNNAAALRAAKLLEHFDGIDCVIMCGIGGGVPHPSSPESHVRLGDIVVSDRFGVIQTDLGKQRLGGFEHRHDPRPPSARMLEAVKILERGKLAQKRPWEAYLKAGLATRGYFRPDLSTDYFLDEEGNVVEHPLVSEPSPRVFLGPIASSNAVQGDFKKRDNLRDTFKVKAIEMEGSGIADATWEFGTVGFLDIRGICDYCDDRIKHLQTDTWKPYASMVAAAYLRSLLEVIPGG